MQARLTGLNFEIIAVTPEEQAVSGLEDTKWKWEIKAKSSGLQKLHLTLSALVIVEGNNTYKTIRTFDKEIKVQVSIGHRITKFIIDNVKWMWTPIIFPIFVWVWRKIRKKKIQQKKSPNSQSKT